SVRTGDGADRGGTAALSLRHSRRVPNVRHLFESVGICAADAEQCFLGADVRSDFSDRTPDFFGDGCGWIGVGMGVVAERAVLVHARDLGDESGGIAADDDLLAGSDSGGSRRLDAVVSV